MAGNFDDTNERDSGNDRDDFDLDQELESLSSLLKEMGVDFEDSDEDSGGAAPSSGQDEAGDDFLKGFLDDFLFEDEAWTEEDRPELSAQESRAAQRYSAEENRTEPSAQEKSVSKESDSGIGEPADTGADAGIKVTGTEAEIKVTGIDAGIEDAGIEDAGIDAGIKDAGTEVTGTEDAEIGDAGGEAGDAEDVEAEDREGDAGLKEMKKVEREVDKALVKAFGKPFSWKRELLSWAAMFALAFALAFSIDNFLIVNATVPTGSMQNTIMAGDRMIGFRLSYLFSEPERGDIIIFEYPDDPEEIYVKRVIGLPGETVTITDGKIYINDSTEPLEEDYLPEEWVWKNDGYTFIVPEGCYLCLGDNRNNSHDARSWTNTYVTKDAILGKAILCYWPSSDAGWLN